MPERDERRISEQETEFADAREKQRQQEAASAEQPVRSEKLLPFLNAAHERHTDRIAVLNVKKQTRLTKIERNTAKQERLEAKADRIAATSEMLRRLTAGTRLESAADALIGRNMQRIEKIRKKKLPKIRRKITRHMRKIAKIDRKIAVRERKAVKCEALSGIIGSFVMTDPEKRRTQFTQSLDTLHRVTKESLTAKIERYNDKMDRTYAKHPELRGWVAAGTPLKPENEKTVMQLEALMTKIQNAEEKLRKLDALSQPYSDQPAEQQDMLQSLAETQLDAAAERGETRVSPLAEAVCVSAAERAAERTENLVHEAAKQLRAVFSIEQNGEIRYYEAENAGPEDILRAGKAQRPMIAAEQIGHRLSEMEFAEIEQSDRLAVSVAMNADSRTATVYEINGGKGGVRDENRSNQNTVLEFVSLAPEKEHSGFQKFNPEYFKAIPRADRLTDTRTVDAAQKIISELNQQGIPFSAVFRENGTASVTVNQAQHGAVYLNAVRAAGEPLPAQTQQQDRTVRTPAAAERISAALDDAGIPHSSMQQGSGTVIVTAPQDREQTRAVIAESEQAHRKQFIHPEVYRQIPKEERFTQRMTETQARAAVEQLAAQGVPHSAVLNGDRSAVTVGKEAKGFVLNREKRGALANRASKAQHRTQQHDTAKKQHDLN